MASSPGFQDSPAAMATFAAALVDGGLINRHDLAVASAHASAERLTLAEAVVALHLVEEEHAFRLLAKSLGVSFVDLDATPSSELAVRLVPERVARRHRAVPLAVDNKTLTYASSRPRDGEAERDLAFACGRRVLVMAATPGAVEAALDRAYPKLGEVDQLLDRLKAETSSVQVVAISTDARTDSAIVNLCNFILGRAVDVGASDIHIESGQGASTVRYRICGVLEPVLTIPANATLLVRNRFKVMANADIAVRHRPQDGAFHVKVNDRLLDVRLSVLPAIDGEKLVMRVVDGASPLKTLESLGYDPDTLSRFTSALSRPDGLVLVTGPTGSGKSTSLYAALAHLRSGKTHIVSVEDPVERVVPGVTQIPVNVRGGNSLGSILKSLLRQDPNVLMVGEIRDAEIAEIVGQAAYTGHLVLSSLHTADAASAITRLTNLGLEPYKIAESLTAVLAQRLVRSLCPNCMRHHTVDESARLGERDGVPGVPASAGPGCDHCRHTGFLERVPVAELLTPSDALRAEIARGATAYDIRKAMTATGFLSMRQHALELVQTGVTSIDEVNRVLAEETTIRQLATKSRSAVIAEDDRITRMLLRVLLEREGFTVFEAENGSRAVEIATREHPDIMLVDLRMPEMDGFETITRLRRDFSLAATPIVVVTAADAPDIEKRVLALGADDYLVKPFDDRVLTSRVRGALSRRPLAIA